MTPWDLIPNDLKDFFSAAFSSSIGSIIGTAIKMMRNPPRSIGRLLGEVFIRVTVGTLAGGICVEWFGWGPWVSSSIAAAAAICADEIIRGLEAHARKLKDAKLPFPIEFKEPKDGT